MQMLKKPLAQRQSYTFETLKLDAGTHTWIERMRLMEEKQIFHDRELIITAGRSFRNINDYIR